MSMYQITLAKMLVLLRLVIIASLAGYSLPTASAAMHGSTTSTTVQSENHHAMTNGDHVHGDETASPDDMQKTTKQECCKDFCVSFAIVATTDLAGGPLVMASIRKFIDDSRVVGELVPLHRPPNI